MQLINVIFGLLFGLVLCFMVLLFTMFVATFMFGYGCKEQAEVMGTDYKFSVATGCIVKMDNLWVPASSLVPVEKNGKIIYSSKYKNRTELEVK